mmetsp:Transcript_30635/g.50604  ORF Transcript_30635/g.50604 Transcript_30635/m.50604 type:complete len:258 (-) Transcript_30635:30-803(-)|eukprot:CAMPEP_0119012882 /NCGR_PEP_ID=MMETSP1176-20130426/7676_1 /TAXON_ID=265551 /ORGANISM="Synedropsis recta cf, Strain CCMP1620" /LENGTH=257 /DNA_ID=CAMNT_0006965919 /DNA_START=126 /DNA_END=899 /DNA_ORIENTATION=+
MGLSIIDHSVERTTPAFKPKAIRRIAQNIFVVQATLRTKKLWKISRNMVIIRVQEELTLINAIRLNKEGEEFLQSLGFVARVIRLGTTTGTGAEDDLHYRNFHGAQIWAPGNSKNYQIPLDRIITKDSVLPFAHSKTFIFKNTIEPEAAILIQPQGKNSKGGLLLASEALQNQVDNDLLSVSARTAMRISGMLDSKIVVPQRWLKSHQDSKLLPLRDDFERLLRLDFTRLIGATGAIVPVRAKEETVLAIERAFPVW